MKNNCNFSTMLNYDIHSEEYAKLLLFATMDIPAPDKNRWAEIILSTPKTNWFFDDYRTVSILALRTHSGGTSRNETENISKPEKFQWTAFAFPDLISYFEKYVFPWSTDQCRIAVLHTPPGGLSSTHIDCAPNAVGSIQHKFRIVLKGNSNTLYFETQEGRLWAPDVEKPFIMDGSWPHGLVNSPDEDKLTICLGSPFTHSQNYPPLEPLLNASNIKRPCDADNLFEKKYSKY